MRLDYEGFSLVLDERRATVRMLGPAVTQGAARPVLSEKVGVGAVMQFLLLTELRHPLVVMPGGGMGAGGGGKAPG